jgi:hypothetical protein
MLLTRCPHFFTRYFKVIAIVTGLSLGIFGFASATSVRPPAVPIRFDPYIHRVTGAPADPVNIIFLTSSPDTVAADVHKVLAWDVVDGSPMLFVDNGASQPIAWQMGIQFTRSSRWHMRIEQVTHDGTNAYVLAAVHRDDDAPCGHVGTAFDKARRVVGSAFANAGYDVTKLQLGNTQSGLQCDGSYTAGDGTALVIDLTKPPHQG